METRLGIQFPFEQTCLKRKSQPEEVAGANNFLPGEENSYSTGAVFVVDGG